MTKKQKQSSKIAENTLTEKQQEVNYFFHLLGHAIVEKSLICSSPTGLREDLCKKEIVTIDNYDRHLDRKLIIITDGMNETVVNLY
jgi:hypothetical protein